MNNEIKMADRRITYWVVLINRPTNFPLQTDPRHTIITNTRLQHYYCEFYQNERVRESV